MHKSVIKNLRAVKLKPILGETPKSTQVAGELLQQDPQKSYDNCPSISFVVPNIDRLPREWQTHQQYILRTRRSQERIYLDRRSGRRTRK
jgi:hypothetical protein